MQASEHFIEWPELNAQLEILREHLDAGDDTASAAILKTLVPEYYQPVYDQAESA